MIGAGSVPLCASETAGNGVFRPQTATMASRGMAGLVS